MRKQPFQTSKQPSDALSVKNSNYRQTIFCRPQTHTDPLRSIAVSLATHGDYVFQGEVLAVPCLTGNAMQSSPDVSHRVRDAREHCLCHMSVTQHSYHAYGSACRPTHPRPVQNYLTVRRGAATPLSGPLLHCRLPKIANAIDCNGRAAFEQSQN